MRSGCPLNYGLEVFGDKWTLLIIRDLMFFKKRYYNEFLASEEGISTNILADRLALLEKWQLISKKNVANHKQKILYSLTEKGIDLLPLLIDIGLWSDHYAEEVLDINPALNLMETKKNRADSLASLRKSLFADHLEIRNR